MNTRFFAYLTVLVLSGLGADVRASDLLPLGSVKQIEAGYAHSCALLDSGIVKCWGDNYYGQLGDGTSTPRRAIASAVVGLSNVTQIAVGATHTCAVISNSSLKCWGAADYGQLGIATHGASSFNTPQSPVLSGQIIAVSAGSDTTCALDVLGNRWCWGANDDAQVGDGTTVDRFIPQKTITPSFESISVGPRQVCGTDSSSLKCWGTGYFGFGDSRAADVPPVVSIGMGSDVVVASIGGNYLCAVRSDASLWCLGANDFGQLGDNSTTLRTWPVQAQVGGPAAPLGAESVSAGSAHTCAVTVSESAYCWGNNSHGQLGNFSRTELHVPTVVSLANVQSISASKSGQHTCATTVSGQAYCWGQNDSGQVGIGAIGTDVLVPAAVLDDDRVFADGFEVPTVGGI